MGRECRTFRPVLSTDFVGPSDANLYDSAHSRDMLDPKAVGRRIVELRRAAGITRQEDFAALFNVSRSAIAMIETGGDLPGRDLAIAMADYFRIPLDWLFCRQVPSGGPLAGKFVQNRDELAWLRFWESLNDEERTAAIRMLRIPDATGTSSK